MTTVRILAETRPSRPHFPEVRRNARSPKLAAVATMAWAGGRFLMQLPAHGLLLLIRIYQRTLSPVLPVIFGSACGCRFAPTCSHYAADAIRTHGVLVGIFLGAIRLIKCTPLHPGGYDPVPPRRSHRRCTRQTPQPTHPADVAMSAADVSTLS